jgi:glycosyltransferase involved in cell wall biosynthesis
MIVWIINPYGNLLGEGWRTYRSTMIANALIKENFTVHQFISNYEHRSKTFRGLTYNKTLAGENYFIHKIPCLSYKKHISLDRIFYERSFAKNLKLHAVNEESPDLVIISEPALFYYDILLSWIKRDLKAKILIDIIDIWPELFELLFPNKLVFLGRIILKPFYLWRRRLYSQADALIAVSKDYLKIGLQNKQFGPSFSDVVYWSYPNEAIVSNQSSSNLEIQRLIGIKKENEIWGIYAGTLGENYDLSSVFEATKWINSKLGNDKFKLIVAGDGPLKALCEKMNDNGHIIFVGRLDTEDLSLILNKSDFAFSTYKGKSTVSMPIKAFDYLFFGLPLINSLGRDLGRFVFENKIGVNYKAESIDELQNAMLDLIKDDQKRILYKENCLKLSQEFSESKQYCKFVVVIKNTLRGT